MFGIVNTSLHLFLFATRFIELQNLNCYFTEITSRLLLPGWQLIRDRKHLPGWVCACISTHFFRACFHYILICAYSLLVFCVTVFRFFCPAGAGVATTCTTAIYSNNIFKWVNCVRRCMDHSSQKLSFFLCYRFECLCLRLLLFEWFDCGGAVSTRHLGFDDWFADRCVFGSMCCRYEICATSQILWHESN